MRAGGGLNTHPQKKRRHKGDQGLLIKRETRGRETNKLIAEETKRECRHNIPQFFKKGYYDKRRICRKDTQGGRGLYTTGEEQHYLPWGGPREQRTYLGGHTTKGGL